MLKAGTVAAILAFCSVSAAAPASWGSDSWGSTGSGSYTTPPAWETATGGSSHETATASSYYTSLSYAHNSPSHSTEAASASATGSAAGSASTTVAASTVVSAPSTPTGLSKVQQILLSDTRADAVNNVLTSNSDFIFDFNKARKGGKSSEIVQANRKAFPALTGTGIGMAVGFLGPCGFNTPHVHNRATEFLIVTKGKIVSEMVIENGVNNAKGTPRDITNTVEELQATPYFMGALHTQYNPTCKDVTFVAPLSNEDFGANTIAQAYLALKDETIAGALGNVIDGADIDKFRSLLSSNVTIGVEQCLKTCGISKRK
ncbi:RmlC-like cupin domain-containing protein [Annulohypoxylon maeteangense]|uniref:RmlC-like cupin domain-containing protein n=1 Tax=Annulohypoxylon maeteangense TaxID=1927788 RepID=UPI00200876B8|nr:RmlC-like cupin domain-containing protein [Annulohypoxylon maeteangense]KAI0882745.1 RmlC-like cupin domain-containing protein [Annulohypoxylon maeteangense]